ncbi:putative ribosomal protein S2 [Helianthus anomalus]
MAQPKPLSTKEADVQMMLSAEVHLGTKNCDFQMERYVFKRRNDVIECHIFEIEAVKCVVVLYIWNVSVVFD